MPVSPAVAESNRSQTERLRKLVRRLDPAMLAVRLPNGWTVAGTLAHVAFWDRQRLCLMRRWAAGDICSDAYDGELFNAALQPLLEMIPPERAAAAALQAAEEVDALLLEVSDEVVEAALARPDAPNLDRGSHREDHLDRIEKALTEAGHAGEAAGADQGAGTRAKEKSSESEDDSAISRPKAAAKEIVLYDAKGQPTAYSEDGESVWLFNGTPVAYFLASAVYTYSGKQIGWWERGWLRDMRGYVALFSDEAFSGGPVRPPRFGKPRKQTKGRLPFKNVRQVVSVRPVGLLDWSQQSGASFFE